MKKFSKLLAFALILSALFVDSLEAFAVTDRAQAFRPTVAVGAAPAPIRAGSRTPLPSAEMLRDFGLSAHLKAAVSKLDDAYDVFSRSHAITPEEKTALNAIIGPIISSFMSQFPSSEWNIDQPIINAMELEPHLGAFDALVQALPITGGGRLSAQWGNLTARIDGLLAASPSSSAKLLRLLQILDSIPDENKSDLLGYNLADGYPLSRGTANFTETTLRLALVDYLLRTMVHGDATDTTASANGTGVMKEGMLAMAFALEL